MFIEGLSGLNNVYRRVYRVIGHININGNFFGGLTEINDVHCRAKIYLFISLWGKNDILYNFIKCHL